MTDQEAGKRAGLRVRYLPAVYSFEYENLHRTDPDLSKEDYATTVDDTGELHAVRLYGAVEAEKVVLDDRFGAVAKKYGEEAVHRELDSGMLLTILTNNEQLFKMHGITELDGTDDITPDLVGVDVGAFLAGYWHILETTDLTFIGQRDFYGHAQTDLGVLPIVSL